MIRGATRAYRKDSSGRCGLRRRVPAEARAGGRVSQEEVEVERYRLAPPFVEVPGLGSDVEGEQQTSSGAKGAAELCERPGQLVGFQMDDRVEGHDAAPCGLVDVEVGDRALPEGEAGVQTSRMGDHLAGEVDAERGDNAIMEVARHVPRTASEVGDRA
jgi:hypothetical protein